MLGSAIKALWMMFFYAVWRLFLESWWMAWVSGQQQSTAGMGALMIGYLLFVILPALILSFFTAHGAENEF